MTRPTFRNPWLARCVATLTCLAVALATAPPVPAQAAKMANVQGVILDPEGKPAKDFRVVFRDVVTNTRYTSTAADAQGNYRVELPVGVQYKVDGVIADDGVSRLPVGDMAPIALAAAGPTSVNVRYTMKAHAPGAAASGGPTAKAPWYKTPGAITAIVVASVGVAALAAQGPTHEASPF